jgi:hypothetical protein
MKVTKLDILFLKAKSGSSNITLLAVNYQERKNIVTLLFFKYIRARNFMF